MEVKIISGYGENTFQMDDADTMSLLNNAMSSSCQIFFTTQ